MKAKGTDVVVFKSSLRLEGNCGVAGEGGERLQGNSMRVMKALARDLQRLRVAAARLCPLHFDSIRTRDCCALPTGCRPASPAGLVHLAPALRAWLGFF